MNGPSLREVAEKLDDDALHEMVVGLLSAAAACAVDGGIPLDVVDDLKFALRSGRLTNSAARGCRLALKQIGDTYGA
jgi:hypothetical protein